MPHIALARTADVVLVAPATARLLGSYAAGIADDLLTATLLATRAPVVVCPAMHTEMWEHPATRANVALLRERGVHVVDPDSGKLAAGDVGAGRLPDPDRIVAEVFAVLCATPQDLAGRHVLVTAGGTREPIDPVRFLGNRSSGKQGEAVAVEAARRGAHVVLVTAAVDRPAPPGVDVVPVETSAEMEAAVMARHLGADAVVMAAAVADFRPKRAADRKLRKDEGVPDIVLEPTTDILAALGRAKPAGQVLVGFAAETDDVRAPGRGKAAGQAARRHRCQRRHPRRGRLLARHQRSSDHRGRRDRAGRPADLEGGAGRSGTRPGRPPPGGQRRKEHPLSNWTFTSESVTEGHPDKMADQVSDAILDAILAEDPTGRVACETLLTTGLVVVAGEITTRAYVDIPKIVRQTVCAIGYDRESYGFDGNTCGVITSIDEQSPDISQGVTTAYEVRKGTSGEDQISAQGAGDQGMMFGYACDETEDLMPLPIWLAHRLAQRLAEVRKAGVLPYLRPDGKTQVTFEYENGRPVRLKTVLISTQHQPGLDNETLLKPDLREHVIHPLLPEQFVDDRYQLLANPTGSFVLGGPHADTGLTGRKIIVDTYGGAARHGGGAFSGKDPSKVDRSAAYAARWVAKHIVASGAATRCEIQVAYAIGVARPVSIMVETFGTSTVDPRQIEAMIDQVFDLRPAAIIRDLDLRRPIYRRTAAYGHFGRSDKEFSWEHLNRLDDVKSALGL